MDKKVVMKIAIMGAGGVGGFYGGRMAKAGEDVVLIARGAHLNALQSRGLRVESAALGDFALPDIRATDDPATVGLVDLVVICVKTYDIGEAIQAIRPMIGEETMVIPLLNGVCAAEEIGDAVGSDHVLGGTVYVNANIVEPGVVRHLAMDRLVFGELRGGSSARCKAVHGMFNAAGIEAELSPDIRKDIWSKYVAMVAVAGVTSVLRLPEKTVMDDPNTRALLVDSMREIEALANCQGIKLDHDLIDKILSMLDGKPPDTKPSMLIDLEQGRRLEVEALQGTAVRLGKELGVPTPVNEFIYAALKLHAEGAPAPA
ncbi:MAG: 2-dehydropantoate 2-reductase [SAR324 cluster bacterium]|nr:2-dehydropantoate 2-reductase [SAR324 cluster bacterium]